MRKLACFEDRNSMELANIEFVGRLRIEANPKRRAPPPEPVRVTEGECYTQKDDILLTQLRNQGAPLSQIAAALGRSVSSVGRRSMRLELPKRQRRAQPTSGSQWGDGGAVQ